MVFHQNDDSNHFGFTNCETTKQSYAISNTKNHQSTSTRKHIPEKSKHYLNQSKKYTLPKGRWRDTSLKKDSSVFSQDALISIGDTRRQFFRIASKSRSRRGTVWNYVQESYYPLSKMVAQEYQGPLQYQENFCNDFIGAKGDESQAGISGCEANAYNIPATSSACNSLLIPDVPFRADQNVVLCDGTCDLCKSQNVTKITSRDNCGRQECTLEGDSARLPQLCYRPCCASNDVTTHQHSLRKGSCLADNLIIDECLECAYYQSSKQAEPQTQQRLCASCISCANEAVCQSRRFDVGENFCSDCMYEAQPVSQDAGPSWKYNTTCCCKSTSSINIDDLSLLVNSSSSKIDGFHPSGSCRRDCLKGVESCSSKHWSSPQDPVMSITWCELCFPQYQSCQIPNCQDCLVADLQLGATRALVGQRQSSTLPWMNKRLTSKELKKLQKKVEKKQRHASERRERASVTRWKNNIAACLRCVFPSTSTDRSSSGGSGSDDEGDGDDGPEDIEFIEHGEAASDGADSDGGSDSGSDDGESFDSIEMLEDQFNALETKDNNGGNASDGAGDPGSDQSDSLTELGSGESEEETDTSDDDADDSFSDIDNDQDMDNDQDSYSEDLQSILIDERE